MFNSVLKMPLGSVEWTIPEKSKQWRLKIYYSEKNALEFLDLSLHP